jgi:hypothetical protein
MHMMYKMVKRLELKPKMLRMRPVLVGAGLGDDVYDASATFGKFMAWFGLIVSVIISLILLGIGSFLLISKSKYSSETQAVITKSDCRRYDDTQCFTSSNGQQSCQTRPTSECAFDYTYRVNQQEIQKTNQIVRGDRSIEKQAGETVPVWYDPNNPQDSTLSRTPRTMIAWILIAIAIILLLGSIFTWYITQRFKIAAAAHGIGSAAGIAYDGFR